MDVPLEPVASLYNTLSGVIRKTISVAHDKSMFFLRQVLRFQNAFDTRIRPKRKPADFPTGSDFANLTLR